MSEATGPLSHIRVLDLTEFLAGPYGTQILGDLGAEIIKIESVYGDSSRSVPPNYVAGSSTYFTCINRNKKSLVVDLKSPEGIAVVRDALRTTSNRVRQFSGLLLLLREALKMPPLFAGKTVMTD